ncbi:DEAD/DEAH box helicase [Entomomonas asaccharolytica]|uniref:DEAD/DEAH box helicase n=1 Tax=Entomomonas asaccharolytica TaxID=2785331 RepID=A0A974NED9_9GAMM|nr:DEAD/DEAH box helicase [Entomomonas asaccharolytica]QQP85241.1 DEAD/DEAH box helicase [Entomomonas asaccharolytica]
MSFTSLGLSELISETTKTLYETPTTLQQQAIPVILQNNDLMVATPTAETGKVGSFVLPIIEKLFPQGNVAHKAPTSKQPKVLILVASTDEAIQITEYFKAYSFDFSMTVGCVLDSTNSALQTKILSHGVDILVASPTRLVELIEQQAVELSAVEIFVLDEAEQLTNNDSIKTTKQVIDLLPAERQNLLYAANFTDDVIVLAHFLLKNPERIEINITPSIEHIKQSVFYIPTRQKAALLTHLINKHQWPQILLFTRTKYGASRLSNYLTKKGINSATIHSNKTQNARNKSLIDFKENLVQVLIATDITTESLEINQLPCIINFDLPYIEDDYIQRINTIDSVGEAISFVSPEEEKLLLVIEDFIKQKIADGDMSDFVFDAETNEENNDRFRRIFRHPAVGRKSRKRKTTLGTDEPIEAPAAEDLDDDLAEKRASRVSKTNFSKAKTKTTRNPYNKHRRNAPVSTVSLDDMPPDRPEDEFRDDEYDNFGNSVDYISPYQDKAKNARGKRFTKATPPTTTPVASATKTTTSRPQRAKTTKPKTATTNNSQATDQRRPRNSLYRRNNRTNTPLTTPSSTPHRKREIMTALPSSELKEPQQRRTPTTTPAIIHRKHSRVDRLPTIEQLDSMPNRHIPKSEKPMLLSRKNLDDE